MIGYKLLAGAFHLLDQLEVLVENADVKTSRKTIGKNIDGKKLYIACWWLLEEKWVSPTKNSTTNTLN